MIQSILNLDFLLYLDSSTKSYNSFMNKLKPEANLINLTIKYV